MSQVETTTPATATQTRRARVEAFLKDFEWTWTTAVVFSLGLVFFLLITTSVLPSFWLYLTRAEVRLAGPDRHRSGARRAAHVAAGRRAGRLRRAAAAGARRGRDGPAAPGRSSSCSSAGRSCRTGAASCAGNPTTVRPADTGRIGRAMAYTKTEVDIHEDYVVEAVDPAWLAQGVKSPKHLMLDPDNCILCRACEDVCPWNCIYMMSPGIVEGAADRRRSATRSTTSNADLRRRRQRLHAMLGVRRPLPHRHPVLCATARGFQGRHAHDGRGADLAGRGRMSRDARGRRREAEASVAERPG